MIWEISYRVTLKSPLVMVPGSVPEWRIPGSSIKGAVRAEYQKRKAIINNDELGSLESLLFGTVEGKSPTTARMIFSDLICSNPSELETSFYTALDSRSGSAKADSLHCIEAFPRDASFDGKVIIDGAVNGIERSVALSAILDIPNLGAWRSRGYGSADVEITRRSGVIAFISYAWESEEHKQWVLAFAQEIIANDITVLIDQLSPSFNVSDNQSAINHWMENCISNSDKIVAVLTPTYKYKAENDIGGVGYEYSQLRREEGLVSHRLDRYLGALRFGSQEDSTPVQLKNTPIFDMNKDMRFGALADSIRK